MNWPAHQCRENTASFHGRHLGAPKNPLLACQNSTFFQWMFFLILVLQFFRFLFEYGYPCCFWLVSVCNLWKMSPKWHGVPRLTFFGIPWPLASNTLKGWTWCWPSLLAHQDPWINWVWNLVSESFAKMKTWRWIQFEFEKVEKRPLKPTDFLIQFQLMSTWQSPKPNLGEKNMESKNK